VHLPIKQSANILHNGKTRNKSCFAVLQWHMLAAENTKLESANTGISSHFWIRKASRAVGYKADAVTGYYKQQCVCPFSITFISSPCE